MNTPITAPLAAAVFFDRDGVINVYPGPGKFVLNWEQFHFIPGLAEQMRRLRAHDFRLIVITNQSGVGRGLMNQRTLDEIHARMQAHLGPDAFDAIYYCHHHPNTGCTCRKPSPELIQKACTEHHLNPRDSFVIGDSGRDIEMGRAAGCRTVLCRADLPKLEKLQPLQRPDYLARTLDGAVDWILANSTGT